jgi:hypothetical protein
MKEREGESCGERWTHGQTEDAHLGSGLVVLQLAEVQVLDEVCDVSPTYLRRLCPAPLFLHPLTPSRPLLQRD